jgi:hypothetical protein
VDTKNLANEQRHSFEVGFPFHDPNEKEIQNRDRELRDCGRA